MRERIWIIKQLSATLAWFEHTIQKFAQANLPYEFIEQWFTAFRPCLCNEGDESHATHRDQQRELMRTRHSQQGCGLASGHEKNTNTLMTDFTPFFFHPNMLMYMHTHAHKLCRKRRA